MCSVYAGKVGAGRGNRTPTGLLAPADFKSAASANFAIPASQNNLSRFGALIAAEWDIAHHRPHCQFSAAV